MPRNIGDGYGSGSGDGIPQSGITRRLKS